MIKEIVSIGGGWYIWRFGPLESVEVFPSEWRAKWDLGCFEQALPNFRKLPIFLNDEGLDVESCWWAQGEEEWLVYLIWHGEEWAVSRKMLKRTREGIVKYMKGLRRRLG